MPTGFNNNGPDRPVDPSDFNDDAIWDLLSQYADGETTPEQAAEVESLLLENPAFQRDLQFFRVTADTIHSYTEVEPPAQLRSAIFAATTRRQSTATRLLAAWGDFRQAVQQKARYAMPMGALAAAALLGVAVWPRIQHVDPVVPSHTVPLASVVKTPPAHSHDKNVARASKPLPRAISSLAHNPPPIAPGSGPMGRKVVGDADSGAKPALARNTAHAPVVKQAVQRTAPVSADPDKTLVTPDSPSDTEMAAVRPGMEDGNRHRSNPSATPPQPLGSPTSGDDGGALAVNSAQPDMAARTVKEFDSTPAPRVTVAKLPPEAYQYLTNAQMKQQQRASTLGYDRDTVKSIQRKELTVSFIKGSL